MKPKKERTPRITVCGSHFAEYRKLCNGIAVSRTRTTFFVGQISNLLRYHCSTIPYPLIKPPVRFMTRLVRTSYHTSRNLPELTAYYSLSPVALISGKVFYMTLLVGCISCSVENSSWSESN